MNRKVFIVASVAAIIAISFSFQIASAHTTIHVGNYDVEIGWMDEPPIIGQRNAIVMNVSNTTSTNAPVDISKLSVDVTYGGQTKTLSLQPLGEGTTNQYIAPILPTIPGQYTIQLRGQLDTTNISQDVQPEEVMSSDVLAFPSVTATQQGSSLNWSEWLSVIALIVGVAGLTLAAFAFRKNH